MFSGRLIANTINVIKFTFRKVRIDKLNRLEIDMKMHSRASIYNGKLCLPRKYKFTVMLSLPINIEASKQPNV